MPTSPKYFCRIRSYFQDHYQDLRGQNWLRIEGKRGSKMWIVCKGVHKMFCSANSVLTVDPSLGNRLITIAIIKLHWSCENRKMTNGNTAYIYNIIKIKILKFILWLNTGYLSIGSLDPSRILSICRLFYEKSSWTSGNSDSVLPFEAGFLLDKLSWQQLCSGTRQKGRSADKKLHSST